MAYDDRGVCVPRWGRGAPYVFLSGSRDKHTAHQVRSKAARLSLKGLAPIAREVQVKQGLRAAVFRASSVRLSLYQCCPRAPLARTRPLIFKL